MLKQAADRSFTESEEAVLDIIEDKMSLHDGYIHACRKEFIEHFKPYFEEIYTSIADGEHTSITYTSQVADRDIRESLRKTRERDLILGWTSQGIHKDNLELRLDNYPLRQVGSQGQQKTFLIALKLAQACFLAENQLSLFAAQQVKPLLLLDDIFDKLDARRVERIVRLVGSDRFGQTFITDTDRQHIVSLIPQHSDNSRIFVVENGIIV